MHESEKGKGSHSVMSNSLRPHGLQPTRLLRPWDLPGQSTGLGCHCLLLGPSQASPNLLTLELLLLPSPKNWGCVAWAPYVASRLFWVSVGPSFPSKAGWTLPRVTLLSGPETLLCLVLFSASSSAPGMPSLASKLYCHSPCPPTQLSSFIPSCLSTNGHCLPCPEALPQRLSSTHFDCGAWECSQLQRRPASPLWGCQPPGQTLGCWLSPWSPLPSRCHCIYFDCWNLIWIWSNSGLVIKIHLVI